MATGIFPVKCIPALIEMPVSTCATVYRGQVMMVSAAGYLTNTISNYATGAPVAGVAAETKATASALSSANTIRIWPALDSVTWEATSSGTPAEAGVGSVCNLKNNNRGVIYSATAVTTGGSFVITNIDSANTKVRGRLINTFVYGRRTPSLGGTT